MKSSRPRAQPDRCGRGSRAPVQVCVAFTRRLCPAVIHRTQHWFHGRISREESHRIIKQQGLVDG